MEISLQSIKAIALDTGPLVATATGSARLPQILNQPVGRVLRFPPKLAPLLTDPKLSGKMQCYHRAASPSISRR